MGVNCKFSFLLLLLLFIPISFTQSEQITLRNVPWAFTVIAAILVVLSIIVIAYFLSKAFGIKELSSWANNELYQIIMMSILVFIIFGILRFENLIFEAYGFKPSLRGENPAIDNAKEYLNSVRSYLTFVLGGLLVEKAVLSISKDFLKNLHSSVSKGILGKLEMRLFKGLKLFKIDDEIIVTKYVNVFVTIIEGAITSFSVVYAFNSMQLYFLDFIERFAFHFFLPFGLFFRVFSFTRRFGNVLIALAISFYIVFPLTYLLSQNIVDAVLNFESKGTKYSWRDILGARLGKAELQPLKGEGFIEKIREAMQDVVNPLQTLVTFLVKLFFVLFNEAAFAFVLFTLVPIIGFTITISIAREIGSFLGSDVSLTDFVKML
ncbi:MAG: hypothetical protein NZ903_01935 [Candidatus Micrarchaeota archaeon]|nr:hypothetical protein [Candidatus Micrarchaeota archaeon]